MEGFLSVFLPELMGLAFMPQLEFKRVHRFYDKGATRQNLLQPIIAYFRCHQQVQQAIVVAKRHNGPFLHCGANVYVAVDFSYDPVLRRKKILAFQLILRKLRPVFILF
ncbi:hypothetical protein NDU88_002061 [Pleurodeles waltl]|uniref:Uncharacterized protein n=1 Tax=Pleurodeles waltl TaxID=8319 RepID=A0AAV7TJM4_PLEWA|nr:hypothetical protein NDU88_002061 [Pleurodeles waltl]